MEDRGCKASARRARIHRSDDEKRRIVELTLLPGASVSRVAQAEGVNSHQIFNWRQAYRKDRLGQQEPRTCALLPVILSGPETSPDATEPVNASVAMSDVDREPHLPVVTAASAGAIHIEFPGRAAISIEGGVDSELVRTVLELLRP